MRRMASITALAFAGGAACGSEGRDTGAADSVRAEPAVPADSLVATAPGGVELWFTLAREGKAPDGTTCIDRALEIRRDGRRVPVPLLYTGGAPEIVNDTTARAWLSDGCAPGDAYLVDLRTGRPVPDR